MGTEASESGNFRKLQVMIFGAIPDFILCGLANTGGHHFDLPGLAQLAPLVDDLADVSFSVDALSLSPRLLQTQGENDFGHLAADLSGGSFTDSPGAAHDGLQIVTLFHCF